MTSNRKFRLQRILRLAHLRERAAETEMADARRAAARAEEASVQAATALEAMGDPTADASGSVVDFKDHLLRSQLRAGDVANARTKRQETVDEVMQARREWLDAARRRKGLDELSARHAAARAMVAARAAQRTLDDLAQQRRNRP